MSDMKCPFCKEEIISDVCCIFDKENKDYTNGTQIYKCNKCGLFGNKELVQELDRTKKKLDIAVDALKELRPAEKKSCYLVPTVFTTQRIIDEALEQITALEQKDK